MWLLALPLVFFVGAALFWTTIIYVVYRLVRSLISHAKGK